MFVLLAVINQTLYDMGHKFKTTIFASFFQTLMVENHNRASKMHTSSLAKLQIMVLTQVVLVLYSSVRKEATNCASFCPLIEL